MPHKMDSDRKSSIRSDHLQKPDAQHYWFADESPSTEGNNGHNPLTDRYHLTRKQIALSSGQNI